MQAEDERVREELAADGQLYEGYHPRMTEVHQKHGARLSDIIDEHGGPLKSLVGEDGAEAAWLIAQHDIGNPSLQRRCLKLIEQTVAQGEAPAQHMALLADRIHVLEGRPQVYGTQFDWDERGEMSPGEIEDAENVDERRRSVGLSPLAENTRRQRETVARSNEQPPADWHARRKEMEEWSRSVGWRD